MVRGVSFIGAFRRDSSKLCASRNRASNVCSDPSIVPAPRRYSWFRKCARKQPKRNHQIQHRWKWSSALHSGGHLQSIRKLGGAASEHGNQANRTQWLWKCTILVQFISEWESDWSHKPRDLLAGQRLGGIAFGRQSNIKRWKLRLQRPWQLIHVVVESQSIGNIEAIHICRMRSTDWFTPGT